MLVDATTSRPVGARLVRHLGSGGMSSVFLGQLTAGEPHVFGPRASGAVAIKFVLPAIAMQLLAQNLDPEMLIRREAEALGRVSGQVPRTPFVVDYFTSGSADIEFGARVMRIPWMALEFVDGASEGSTLGERVDRSLGEGLAPSRALCIAEGLLQGAEVLHDLGIVHRDLKPANVLMAGPAGQDVPKIADCGIARLEGYGATFPAADKANSPPEQLISIAGERNPLVGPWSDVHNIAAMIWYVLAGRRWRTATGEALWARGLRRPLAEMRVHKSLRGFSGLAALASVLERGAAARLPNGVGLDGARLSDASQRYLRTWGPSLAGPERFLDVGSFAQAVLPLLADAADQERGARASRVVESVPPDTVRARPSVSIREVCARRLGAHLPGEHGTPICRARCAYVGQDGERILMTFGETLVLYVEGRPHPVALDPEQQHLVGSARAIHKVGKAYVLVCERELLVLQAGAAHTAKLPGAGATLGGTVAASWSDRRSLVVAMTSGSNDSTLDLVLTQDLSRWSRCGKVHGLGGRLRDVSVGREGVWCVGATEDGNHGWALVLDGGGKAHPVRFDGEPPSLSTVVAGRDGKAWLFGDGRVFQAQARGLRAVEDGAMGTEVPVSAGLDPLAQPWAVTTRRVFRRGSQGGLHFWDEVYARPEERPPLVAFGFTRRAVRAIDAHGGAVHIEPEDASRWEPQMPSSS